MPNELNTPEGKLRERIHGNFGDLAFKNFIRDDCVRADEGPGLVLTTLGDGTVAWLPAGAATVAVEEAVLVFPDAVPAGTAFNIQTGVYGGGGPATVFGDVITLPSSGVTFKGDGRIQIYLNGQNLFKGSSLGDEEANWFSTTQLSLWRTIKKFSTIKIVKLG